VQYGHLADTRHEKEKHVGMRQNVAFSRKNYLRPMCAQSRFAVGKILKMGYRDVATAVAAARVTKCLERHN